jgi:hypothetical protein
MNSIKIINTVKTINKVTPSIPINKVRINPLILLNLCKQNYYFEKKHYKIKNN